MASSRLALPSALLAVAVCLLLAACGGAAPVLGAGSAGTQAPDASSPDAIVVATDADGDGRADVLLLDPDGELASLAWRADDAGFAELIAPDEGVTTVEHGILGRPPFVLRSGGGVHRLAGSVSGAAGAPFVVLHTGRADDMPLGPPEVDEVVPAAGVPGTWVTLRGRGLAARGEATRVLFDDVEAAVLVAVPEFVVAVVPMDLAPGGTMLVVERDDERSVAQPFEITAQTAPRIDAVHPQPVVAGALALLRGADLGTPGNDVTVDFDGVAARHVVPLGDRLIVEVPHGAMAGAVTVRVDGVPSEPFNVEITLEQPTPVIEQVTPAAASPGSLVRLDGSNFFVPGERVRVHFGGAPAAVFEADTDSLTVVVPPDADSGSVSVHVGERVSEPATFDLLVRSAPTLVEITPNEGAPRDRILLHGSDLFDLSQWRADRPPPALDPFGDVDVRFGDVRAWAFLPTIEGLSVIVPFRAQSGDVTVSVNGVRSNVVQVTVRETSAP